MKKRDAFIILSLLTCVLMLTSCELFVKNPNNGNLHYLIIGLDYDDIPPYEGNPEKDGSLDSCRNDALQLKKMLDQWIAEGGHGWGTTGKHLFFIDGIRTNSDRPNVNTGYNKNIGECPQFINDGLEEINLAAKANDLTIISYSGHGLSPSLPGDAGALCMQNLTDKDHPEVPGNYSSYYYKLPDLLQSINQIPGRKLLIMDSCFSGNAAEAFNLTQNIHTVNSSAWASLFAQSTLYDWDNFYVLAAATSQTTSAESKENHGFFTYALLKALGWKDDTSAFNAPVAKTGKYVTISFLFKYIKDVTKKTIKADQDVTTNGTSNEVALYYF